MCIANIQYVLDNTKERTKNEDPSAKREQYMQRPCGSMMRKRE